MRAGPLDEVGERRGRLAEAHVVGEAPPEPEVGEEAHPREAAPLVVAQLADEVGRLDRLVEAVVGQAGEQGADPVLVGDRCRLARSGVGGVGADLDAEQVAPRAVDPDRRPLVGRLVVVRELEELQRADPARRRLELADALALAAQLVGVDADPALAGVQQGRARLRRPGELGLGDLGVVDDQLPLDQRLAAEPALAVVGRRRRGLAGDAGRGAHEPLGADQLDARLLELERGDVDEVLRRLEVELDPGRLVRQRQIGEAGHHGGDAGDDVADQLDEEGQVALLAGDVDGPLAALPHVVGRAPAHRVGVVDQLEADLPRVVRVVGHQQAHPRHHHRLARQPAPVAVELVAQPAERDLEVARAAAHHVVGLRQGAEGGPQRLRRRGPASAEIGLPPALVEERAGHAVDHPGEHGARVVARPGGADRRARRVEAGEQVADLLVEHRGPPGDGERALVDDHGRQAAARHDAAGELGEAGEPGERVGELVGPGQVGQPDRRAERIELHRRGVQRGAAVEVDVQARDGAVGDGRVVPARPRAVGRHLPEAGVQPRHRGRVDAVPPPHVQRARPPGALRHVRRAVA